MYNIDLIYRLQWKFLKEIWKHAYSSISLMLEDACLLKIVETSTVDQLNHIQFFNNYYKSNYKYKTCKIGMQNSLFLV